MVSPTTRPSRWLVGVTLASAGACSRQEVPGDLRPTACPIATMPEGSITVEDVRQLAARYSPQPAPEDAAWLAVAGAVLTGVQPVNPTVPLAEQWRRGYADFARTAGSHSQAENREVELNTRLGTLSKKVGLRLGPCFPGGHWP